GQYRTSDQNLPVDSSGSIALDGQTQAVPDAVPLGKLLAGSPQVQSCLAAPPPPPSELGPPPPGGSLHEGDGDARRDAEQVLAPRHPQEPGPRRRVLAAALDRARAGRERQRLPPA